jgi:LytS/YehU family sensor histidine kinase
MLVSIVKINELEEKKNRMMINKIRPHFIYNVLLSIRYFTKKEPDVAYDLIYDFANYLRSNMESLENKKYISWNEELQHIRAYAGIEQKRYGEKLHVIYEVEEAAFKIPPLTIEPLVENAIKHGVGVREEGGTVWIRGHRTGVGYLIEIEDDGVGFNTDALEEKMDVGLNYIRDQLRAMPGTELHIESSPGNGTKVSIEIGVMINEDDTG